MITQEELKAEVEYKPETGEFIRISKNGYRKRVKQFERCDKFQSNGYKRVSILGKRYLAHRLAFLYMTGVIPAQIDHKNLNRSDNRWENLREATLSQNVHNAKKFSKCGKSPHSIYRGVYRNSFNRRKVWVAEIRKDNIKYRLGYFDSEESAARAYNKKAKELYGAFARLNQAEH